MLLTEEQARTKWCPKALHQTGNEEPAANRWSDRDGHHANPAECRCIASDCMAWRSALVSGLMIELRVHIGTPNWEVYKSAQYGKMRSDYFEMSGAWWRYQHTSSDSKGKYDLLVRSHDEGAGPAVGGFCGLAGPVGG